MWLLKWFGVEWSLVELVILAMKSRFVLRPQVEQNLAGFLQAMQAFTHGIKGKPVGDMFVALPGTTQATDKSST